MPKGSHERSFALDRLSRLSIGSAPRAGKCPRLRPSRAAVIAAGTAPCAITDTHGLVRARLGFDLTRLGCLRGGMVCGVIMWTPAFYAWRPTSELLSRILCTHNLAFTVSIGLSTLGSPRLGVPTASNRAPCSSLQGPPEKRARLKRLQVFNPGSAAGPLLMRRCLPIV